MGKIKELRDKMREMCEEIAEADESSDDSSESSDDTAAVFKPAQSVAPARTVALTPARPPQAKKIGFLKDYT